MVKRINKKTVIWIISTLAVLIFSLWKAQYGMGRRDGSFVIQVPYRLWQGDSMFVDEQHLSQMFSFLVYPIMCLYMAIFKNTDGIVLNFSYIFVFFQLLTSVFIYIRLKKINEIGAIISSVAFMLFCSYNLMCLSYNTICIMALTSIIAILLTYKNNFELYIVGLLFAACVLCNPYLSILYFVYALLAIFKIIKDDLFDKKSLLMITLGILTLAIIFILFITSRESIVDIVKSIPDILNDSQYVERSILNKTIGYFWCIINFSKYTLIVYVLYIIVFLHFVFTKQNRDIHFALLAVITAFYYLILLLTTKKINVITIPINVITLFALYMYDNDINKKTKLLYIIPAYFYSYCTYLSSDTGIYALSSATSVCVTFSLMILCQIFEYNKESLIKIVRAAFVCLIACYLTVLFIYRAFIVFNGHVITIQNYKISEGSHKGLIVNEVQYDSYCRELAEIEEIKSKYNGESILVLSNDLWIYLIADDYRIASPSSWLTINVYMNNYPERLNNYYNTHQLCLPDIIYVDDGFEEAINRLEIIDNYTRDILSTNTVVYIKNK